MMSTPMIGLAPDDAGRHDRGQADRSRAEDGDACPAGDLKRVHHGAGPGLQAAAQRRQELQGQVFGNLDEIAFRRQGVGGERRLAEEVAADAAALQRIAAVQALEAEVRLVEVLAIRRVSAPALTAAAAGLVGEHDMIAAL